MRVKAIEKNTRKKQLNTEAFTDLTSLKAKFINNLHDCMMIRTRKISTTKQKVSGNFRIVIIMDRE